MDKMIEKWSKLPLWGKWASGIFLALFISAIGSSLHERHFIRAFLENFVALTLHWGLIGLGFGGAFWLGVQIASKTGKAWLGWAAGLAFFIFIAGPVTLFFKGLPGIGNRMSAISDSDCHIEWDGRSNPTVCD